MSRPLNAVESVWVPFPAAVAPIDVEALAKAHFDWLSATLPLINVRQDDAGGLSIRALGVTLVKLSPPAVRRTSTTSLLVYQNLDSLLYRRHGTFEFSIAHQDAGDHFDISLLDAKPRYPRLLYMMTQLPIHNALTHRFARAFSQRHQTLALPRVATASLPPTS